MVNKQPLVSCGHCIPSYFWTELGRDRKDQLKCEWKQYVEPLRSSSCNLYVFQQCFTFPQTVLLAAFTSPLEIKKTKQQLKPLKGLRQGNEAKGSHKTHSQWNVKQNWWFYLNMQGNKREVTCILFRSNKVTQQTPRISPLHSVVFSNWKHGLEFCTFSILA